jgi:hypothetical protein
MENSNTPGRPPISIVVATAHPWPELKMTLSSLWPQVREVGGELIIADGDGNGVPADFAARFPGAVHIPMPGESVYVLRAKAMARAEGEIVALTEDHCSLPPDWCRQLMETHRAHPDAAAIGGAVENGSTDKWIDWANYFVAHAPSMVPIKGGRVEKIALQANMALKREYVVRQIPPLGVMEMLYVGELSRRGAVLIANPDIVVNHIQSQGFWRTFEVHYHTGRSIAGFRKETLKSTGLLMRLCSCFLLPGFLLLRATKAVMEKQRFRKELLISVPLMLPLAICHSMGELVGYCAGPGSSPLELS